VKSQEANEKREKTNEHLESRKEDWGWGSIGRVLA
jgi:hypothetical protein